MVERLRVVYHSNALLWAIVIVGCALRVQWYLPNRSLWFDEAAVALDVLYRSIPSLLRDLDPQQPGPAPIGFQLTAKLLTSLFGDGEPVLRSLPLLCGLATMPLFLVVAKQYVSTATVPLAVAVFAISTSQVYYASEFKPYISDVFLTLVVLWASTAISERPLTPRRAFGFCALGAVAVWCSFPIAFVLAGSGMGLALGCALSRDWRRLRLLLVVGAGWAASFALYYAISLQFLSGSAILKEYWGNYFLSLSDLTRTRRLVTTVFIHPLDVIASRGWLVAPLFLAGWLALFQRNRTRGLVLLLPIVVTAAVSSAGIYPFFGRLLLFSVPLLLMPTMEGIVQVVRLTGRVQPAAGALSGAVLIGLLSAPSVATMLKGPQDGIELRPLFAYIGAHAARDDTIFVGEFNFVFEYYRPRFGLADRPYVTGHSFDSEWSAADEPRLDALRGRRRVWVVTGTPEVIGYLDGIGRQIESQRETGATLVLYDLGE